MISLFIIGDLCDYGLPNLETMDHSLRAITDTIVLDLEHDKLEAVGLKNPRLGFALRRINLAQAAIAREWVVTLGQRKAKERCAHLICELFWRLRSVDALKDNTFEFPLTQEEVGAAIGVSTVHANRMLQDLRIAGLIKQDGRRLRVMDLRGLEDLALFSPKFLHLGIEELRFGAPPASHPRRRQRLSPRNLVRSEMIAAPFPGAPVSANVTVKPYEREINR